MNRYSNDKEPQGTAGRPILFLLNQNNLCNVLAVVTRYFGGTLLGKGGLVRAYTKAKLTDENGNKKEILTFGPLCILPEYQRMGYGKMLLEYSFKKAIEIGYDTIVISGNPANYVSCGFKK